MIELLVSIYCSRKSKTSITTVLSNDGIQRNWAGLSLAPKTDHLFGPNKQQSGSVPGFWSYPDNIFAFT